MILEAVDLKKTFRDRRSGTVEAVRGVNLALPDRGEIFGFLGPNGAGKTTTVRMLSTLTPPTSGRITVVGCELPKETRRARERIGYVSQAGGVDDGMPVRDNLMLQARISGMGVTAARQSGDRLLEAFDLVEVANRAGQTLSGGQRRRLALALGLVHRPELLFLDEPTLGLDPTARIALWDEVRALRAADTTVFLTTHYLDEADALCDRVAIIDRGVIVAEGSPDDLKRTVSGDVVTVRLDEADTERATAVVGDLPFVREVRVETRGVRCYVDNGGDAVPAVLRALEGHDIPVRSMSVESSSLDDVFLKQTGRSLREQPTTAVAGPVAATAGQGR
ncbi:ATP-binding cassette domain-containing protein [Actinosynnema sp. NPDC047251]|uniref:ABC-type transporter n=1 Tax=Saccharothrix espanaensis (strain ATCC 51144 / DSM 44229 / JCM 9112 / NBRC 15066 / NRRL 15764) TaxID=1179773 RepID=K0K700_SACES|nr:ATP-binding cassette domain-containing protein [Saccharothrix espanaensis]CCH32669.1 ABC-type transporter [Saccharothrix espanaensis DSM 44229]